MVGAVKAVLNNKVLRTIAAIGISFIPGGGYLALAAKGFGAGFVASGGDLKAGIVGAVTFGVASKGNLLASALVGGVGSVVQGGKFLRGFISSGFSMGLGAKFGLGAGGFSPGKFIASSIIGGVSSVLGGGKFKNGAATAAFASLAASGAEAARKPTAQEVTYGRIAQDVYDPLGNIDPGQSTNSLNSI